MSERDQHVTVPVCHHRHRETTFRLRREKASPPGNGQAPIISPSALLSPEKCKRIQDVTLEAAYKQKTNTVPRFE